MPILAFAAKRALIDRIRTLAEAGTVPALDGVPVDWREPGDKERRCIYGGQVRFVRGDAVAEAGVLATDTVAVDLYFRAALPGDDSEATDADVEEMLEAVTADLATNPRLAGALSTSGLVAGQGDYIATPNPEPEVVSILRVQFGVIGEVVP